MRGNGERIGPQNLPTSSVAGGVWNLINQQRAQQRGAWPSATPAVTTDPYFMYVPLLLNTTSTNAAQNNTFLDSSTNNFTITRNGTPTQGSFTPYQPSGYWSGNFAGNGNYLSIARNAALIPTASQNFTFEAWVYLTATPPDFGQVFGFQDYGTSSDYIFFISPSLVPSLWISAIAGTVTTGPAITLNSWNHIAIERKSGNTLNVYTNGVAGSPVTSTTTLVGSGGNQFTIGADQNGDASALIGYISNARIVIGSTVYGSNFTPPTTPLTAITNTVLLTCQSNRFKDNSTNNFAITANGTPKVQAFQPFSPAASYSAATYGGSGYLDQGNAYLTFPLITLGSVFTIEGWFYPTTVKTGNIIVSNRAQDGGTKWFGYDSAKLTFSYSAGNRDFATTITANTWYHFAFVITSSTVSCYLNGLQIGTTQAAPTSLTLDTMSGYGTGGMTGYLSNFRIVNGTAVYTGNFTPPTLAPLQTAGSTSAASYSSTTNVNTSFAAANTSLLTNFTNAGIYDAAWQNNALTVGDAQASTTQYKWSPTSMKFDGTGDYLTWPAGNSAVFGTGDFTVEAWVYCSSNPHTNGMFIIDTRNAGQTTNWCFYFGSGNGLTWLYSSTVIATSTVYSTGTWYYVAYTRSSNTGRLYVNGTQVATGADSNNYNVAPTIAYIATRYNQVNYFDGYIQDLRITKGVARTITTPTAAFPTR